MGTISKNVGALSQTVRDALCLSRSLRVIESDRDPSDTYDFLTLINSNHGSIS